MPLHGYVAINEDLEMCAFVRYYCKKMLFVALVCTLIGTAVCLPEVTYEGKRYISEGAPFSISCIRSSYGAPKWTKDGLTIESGGDYKTSEELLPFKKILMQLRVESARWKHRGRYKCDSLNSKSHRIDIVPLKGTDKNILLERRVQLHPGNTLTLQCESENGIFPINWYKDGQRILESEDDSRIHLDGKTLNILQSTIDDSGDYICATEVSGLSHPAADHLGSLIKVTYATQVQTFQPQIQPIFNRNLSLECKVQGFPIPRITWFVDNIGLEIFQQNDSRYRSVENSEGLPNAVFFIESVNYSDNHEVTCLAENLDGYMETTSELDVRGNKITTNEESPGKGLILTLGSTLVLQCNNTDDNFDEIHWSKNGLPINLTDTRIHIEKSLNSLTIESAVESDTGNYVCAASDMTNATIVVRTVVKISPFENSRNVVQGHKILLICNATQGIPLPTLQWFKDDEPMNTSNPRVTMKADQRGIEGTEMEIADAQFEDRAKYMCVATNDISSDNATILVRVKDKYAALWPFLGICAEVAVLCTIIFIYEKKRQKPDFDESETEHNTENKNIPDQEEKNRDVRQRK